MRRISATNVVNGLKVSPLKRFGRVIRNGHGNAVMDDQWVYVSDGYGLYAINVIRSHYCAAQQLKDIAIMDSVGGGRVTKRLKRFLESVSDKLAFTYKGLTYRVYLRKTGNGYCDFSHCKLYYLDSYAADFDSSKLPAIYRQLGLDFGRYGYNHSIRDFDRYFA